jgi:hypothetical protein
VRRDRRSSLSFVKGIKFYRNCEQIDVHSSVVFYGI